MDQLSEDLQKLVQDIPALVRQELGPFPPDSAAGQLVDKLQAHVRENFADYLTTDTPTEGRNTVETPHNDAGETIHEQATNAGGGTTDSGNAETAPVTPDAVDAVDKPEPVGTDASEHADPDNKEVVVDTPTEPQPVPPPPNAAS